MELRDIISSSKPVRISAEAMVAEAVATMKENKTDYLLIDRGNPNDAYGVVTKWDIVRGPIADGCDLEKTPVISCARKPLLVLNNLDLGIEWVARKMANEGVSRIAVFDREDFLGFVSDIDVLKAAAKEAGSKVQRKVSG